MHSELNAQLAFHLTGMRSAGELEPVEGLALRPALLAGYRDLSALRYDFPLVFTDKSDSGFVASLSQLVDEALRNSPPGKETDRLLKHARRREREIRASLAGGRAAGRLSELWNVPPALPLDGELADCDATLPVRFMTCAWSNVQARKARRFHEEADRLIVQLAGILAADFVHSDEGRSAQRLAASLASRDGSVDTEAMSRLLAKALPERRLPATRRRRINALLSMLKGQRFFGANAYSFVFDSCTAALKAFRERRPRLLELAKAMAAGPLEAAGEYVEERHDALFGEFAEGALSAALMPDYLVCLNARNLQEAENAGLAELLASGMPVKILVQHDDILERSGVANGPAFGAHARLLAGMALGLSDVYVLQSSASNLYRLRDRVLKGLEYPGAALFSVFSGATQHSEGLPAYLVAAAAMESRAFPAFSYDPSAGEDRAARFSLENNPQPGADWPLHSLAYEDAEHQRVRQDLPFTLADFAACDRRYAGYFARIPHGRSNGEVPSLLMVDQDDGLQKVIVAEPLTREARRCLDAWHGVQALGKREAPPVLPQAKEESVTPAEAAPAAPEPAKAPASDDPYIETPRCTTCEECVKINNRMFVYDANKQAVIADLQAGTYRELVEAAEACQVSIIHPGKPRNPAEPGLEELIGRAQAFL